MPCRALYYTTLHYTTLQNPVKSFLWWISLSGGDLAPSVLGTMLAELAPRGRAGLLALHTSIDEFYERHLAAVEKTRGAATEASLPTQLVRSAATGLFYNRKYSLAVADFLGCTPPCVTAPPGVRCALHCKPYLRVPRMWHIICDAYRSNIYVCVCVYVYVYVSVFCFGYFDSGSVARV